MFLDLARYSSVLVVIGSEMHRDIPIVYVTSLVLRLKSDISKHLRNK
jgi:hypothetical protein